MEEDIQNYSSTVMFRETPCTFMVTVQLTHFSPLIYIVYYEIKLRKYYMYKMPFSNFQFVN